MVQSNYLTRNKQLNMHLINIVKTSVKVILIKMVVTSLTMLVAMIYVPNI